jgi:periplasmic protein TonB
MAAMKSIVLLPLAAVTLLPQISGPRVIQKAEPEYTPEALEAKLVGSVILSLVVDTEGNPTEIKLIKGLGKGLDEKAVECLQKWHFKPGMRNGAPVSVGATVEINFRLPPV